MDLQDLDKFNEFFIDKEEDFIIRIQALDDRLERENGQDAKRLGQLRKAYADLHGGYKNTLHAAKNTITQPCRQLCNRKASFLNATQSCGDL